MTPMQGSLLPLFLAFAAPLAALTEQATPAAAREIAAREGRVVLLELTGSDWCTACIHLRDKILATPEFEKTMGDKVVLVSVDYPRTPALVEKISKKEREQREKLLLEYGIRGLPAVVMQDSNGMPFALIRGTRRTTADYLPLLEEALKVKARRDAAFARAAKLQGMERAKALDAALKLLPETCRDKYTDTIAEIRRLDTEDSLGYTALVANARRRIVQTEALRELRSGFAGKFQPDELEQCREQLDAFLRQPDLLPEIRQQAYMSKADIYAMMHDILSMHACNKQALEVAPNSEVAHKLRVQIQYEETQLLPRLQQKKE